VLVVLTAFDVTSFEHIALTIIDWQAQALPAARRARHRGKACCCCCRRCRRCRCRCRRRMTDSSATVVKWISLGPPKA
jgi:hypothetical protein